MSERAKAERLATELLANMHAGNYAECVPLLTDALIDYNKAQQQAWVELVGKAAPLAWVHIHDEEGARAWEVEAKKMLDAFHGRTPEQSEDEDEPPMPIGTKVVDPDGLLSPEQSENET